MIEIMIVVAMFLLLIVGFELIDWLGRKGKTA